MNSKIEKLAEQADIKFSAHWQHQGIDTAVIIPSDLKKFAELLIRECGKLADLAEPYRAQDLILEYFGVPNDQH